MKIRLARLLPWACLLATLLGGVFLYRRYEATARHQIREVAADAGIGLDASMSLALTRLEFTRAGELAKKLESSNPRHRELLAQYYRDIGECALAQSYAERLVPSERNHYLLVNTMNCIGVTAGNDYQLSPRGIVTVRFQDAADSALLERIEAIAEQTLKKLNVELKDSIPTPVRIDLLKDGFSLSKMSGLPFKAVETTGTIGIASFGRVMLISPRAANTGYAWEDSLAHEMTHLALSRLSDDKAPLWVQEAVAKRIESTWRERKAWDPDYPQNLVAARAVKSSTLPPFDGFGPSFALLPSAEEAAAAYASVSSFIDFYARNTGEYGLGAFLRELRVADDPFTAIENCSGRSFAHWYRLWELEVVKALEETEGSLGKKEKPSKEVGDPGALAQYLLTLSQKELLRLWLIADSSEKQVKDSRSHLEWAALLSLEGVEIAESERLQLVNSLLNDHPDALFWSRIGSKLSDLPNMPKDSPKDLEAAARSLAPLWAEVACYAPAKLGTKDALCEASKAYAYRSAAGRLIPAIKGQ